MQSFLDVTKKKRCDRADRNLDFWTNTAVKR